MKHLLPVILLALAATATAQEPPAAQAVTPVSKDRLTRPCAPEEKASVGGQAAGAAIGGGLGAAAGGVIAGRSGRWIGGLLGAGAGLGVASSTTCFTYSYVVKDQQGHLHVIERLDPLNNTQNLLLIRRPDNTFYLTSQQ